MCLLGNFNKLSPYCMASAEKKRASWAVREEKEIY